MLSVQTLALVQFGWPPSAPAPLCCGASAPQRLAAEPGAGAEVDREPGAGDLGAALEVEIQPLVQKVARKRRQWDSFYLERNARLLDLLERFGGHDFGGLRRTAPIWPGVLPSDRDGTVRNTVALVEAGIRSRRSAIADLGGIDPDGELDRIRQESMSIA